MSSYRSSYIPWQSSLSNNASKANSKDRYGGGGATNTSTRYSPRTSSYNSTISNNTAKRSNDSSSTSSPTSTTYQSYRKATPSILKKYANFSPSSASNGDSIDGTRKDGQESKTAGSSIPRCRPFSKFAVDPSINVVETQGLRYGSASRFGSQIARSPIKEKSLPVFGVSSPIRLNNEPPSEKIMVMTRATSPTPPPNSSFLRSKRRENDDERVLVSEGRRTTAECHSVACQTVDTNVTNKAPTPPSRASSLNTKFGSSVNTHSHVRPTDLPLRSSSFVRSSYLSPNESNKERLSPNFFQTYHNTPSAARTPSPSLMAVRESLSNLVIESATTLSNHNTKAGQDSDDDDSDTENESSYEEDYPIKCEKESSYSIVSSVTGKSTPSAELSDKPPKYPPSPNLRVRENSNNETRLLNNRTSSMSPSTGSGGGKLDSSSEDLSAKHIPRSNRSDENNNDNDSIGTSSKLYPIRKMDSTDVPWWLNSGSGSGSGSGKSQERDLENNAVGYRIRKMDSADSPWWCKTPDSEPSSECNQEQCRRMTVEQNATRSSDDNSRSFGYAIRKMDSADVPWWCNSESSNSSKSRLQEDEPSRKMDSSELLWNADNSEHSNDRKNEDFCKIRKFDSDESEWWTENKSIAEKSSTTPSIPEWWNDTKSEDEADGCVENYKSSKILRIKTILPVPKNDNAGSQLESAPNDEIAEQHQRAVHENDFKTKFINELDNLLLYIGDHTNIDELLGTEVPPPAAPVTPTGDDSSTEDELGEDCKKVTAKEVKIHDGSAYTSTIHRRNYQLDDSALQLYKDGDYSSYLDLDSSISEQQEEFEGFQPRKDSIIVRTQLSVRVHLIIEKLMKSEGRELRRALFSLKQIFQEDKDLVHEFVQNDGLDCLIKVGSDVDQNYQNYILRALGQVMLYVDGMNGVMEHNATIQWLYSLVSSKFRLVVKTALKLLLVFVEYVESNCLLLIRAIHTLNISQGTLPWSNIMRLLHEYDATDTELLIYAMTLINKTLNGIPDLDTYYDQVDLLEEQDMESVIRKYMSKQGTDLDLLRQFQIYEAVLQHEDGEDKGMPLKQLDETIRKTLRNRKSLINGTVNNEERRKSRRHSTGTTTLPHSFPIMAKRYSETSSPEDYRIKPTTEGAGVTPGLRRRRERAERQRSLLREQYENNMRAMMDSTSSEDSGTQNGSQHNIPHICVNNTVTKLESMEDNSNFRNYQNGDLSQSLRRDATVKDITQKLATLQTPDDSKSSGVGRVEEMKGIISKAMEGLAKSQSRCDIVRSPTSESSTSQIAGIRNAEPKKSETELHWEELLATSTRALLLCDLDFSDLKSDDEHDVLAPACSANGVPPPPPPCAVPPPAPCVSKMIANKGKKTVKLFWKEVREDPIVMTKLNSKQLIWDEMYPVTVDTQRLEHLFESRAKDLISKKQHELNKNKEIIVLDPKRSNAINIGMTKLPPPRSIKTAILKMDSTVMNREGIEKLLTMLPTEEERSKIQEAQAANPDLPLGTAEHFLLTLASISELTARLKLWAFKLNYENIEKEIADPLMDLKQGIEVLRANKTFRAILSTLLSIGIFLNGTEVKGFQVEYLSKVPEVKDTVHKHSLLHHLCHIVMEKFPDSSDLYSEIGAITRASRVDFEELANSIHRVEQECKASFDHLKAIAKHDGNTAVKLKLSEFLADCAERIIALGKIHRRVLNRFYKFCLWLGIPLHRIQATKPNELCKIISEFALEYRTTRERVIQQLEKKASHRERNKTRGKMITEVGKFKSKEDRQDAELRQLLGKEPNSEQNNTNTLQSGSLPWRRLRRDGGKGVTEHNLNGHFADAGDELLETLVKTATKTPASRNAPRERKRSRHSDRKSLIPKRSRTRDNMLVQGNMSESP